MDTLDLHVPNIPDQHASLASTTPVLAVNPKAFMQNVNARNQETVSSTANTLRPRLLIPRVHYKSTNTAHDEHQPLGSDDATPEPLQRKGHTKSRRGCYSCKKRRIKVHLTPIHKTEDLRRIIVSRESSSMHSMYQTWPQMWMARALYRPSGRSYEEKLVNPSAGRIIKSDIYTARF
jgi:hypothetical protein